mmetsp:Transcript_4817/g.6374  ORF Transcript_4817/g.6374 Transcript_4817/m.6374 type:complete len:477 (+) Transcript_4817:59-1489(+)
MSLQKIRLFLMTCLICILQSNAFVTPLLSTPKTILHKVQTSNQNTCPNTSILQHHGKIHTTSNHHSKQKRVVMMLRSSLISPSDTWGNAALLTLTATLSQSLSTTANIPIFRLLGAPVSAMALTFLLASLRILPPGGSIASSQIQSLSLHLATPLLLLSADLKDCKQRTGPLLSSFCYASLATLLACVVALTLLPCKTLLSASMGGGGDGMKIAAALMAKNVGGGVNYIAVCNSLQASPNAVAAGLCVDNIFALIYFPIVSALASGKPDLATISDDDDDLQEETKDVTKGEITIQSLSTILSMSTAITFISHTLLNLFKRSTSHALPLSTLLSILVLLLAPSKMLKPLQPTAEVVGTTLLYLFFATAGAPGFSIASSMKECFLPLSFFLIVLYALHGATLYFIRFLITRFSKKKNESVALQRLLTASSAAIGGPATAVALAKSNGWNSLIVPSLLVGNLGYAVATFLGIGFHAFFR